MYTLELPKLIAHRGAPLNAPENTLAALNKAYELGAKWVECDVTLTRDGVPVIFHDEDLQRTTNGKGKIAKLLWTDVQGLDAGTWFGKEYAGEKIPTLKEWLATAAKHRIGLNLEMKVKGKRRAAYLAKMINEEINRYWSKDLPLLISSFNPYCLEAMRQISADYFLALNVNHWTRKWQHFASHYRGFSIHLAHERLTPQRVAIIKSLGLKVLAYTVDDAKRAQQLWAMGVDTIFSNNLQLLKTTEKL